MSAQVNCHCAGCNHRLCTSANSWVPISNTHCTYEDPTRFTEYQTETLQHIREGSPDSRLQGCSIRPLRCKTCRKPVGVRCIETPEAKMQFRCVCYLYPCILYFHICQFWDIPQMKCVLWL